MARGGSRTQRAPPTNRFSRPEPTARGPTVWGVGKGTRSRKWLLPGATKKTESGGHLLKVQILGWESCERGEPAIHSWSRRRTATARTVQRGCWPDPRLPAGIARPPPEVAVARSNKENRVWGPPTQGPDPGVGKLRVRRAGNRRRNRCCPATTPSRPAPGSGCCPNNPPNRPIRRRAARTAQSPSQGPTVYGEDRRAGRGLPGREWAGR